jgi:hypothetical protein
MLEDALSSSTTVWDRFLRGLTPGLPTYLSDWATTNLHTPARFRRFWAHLFWTVPERDRQVFQKWLAAESRNLADPDFKLVLPDWVRPSVR